MWMHILIRATSSAQSSCLSPVRVRASHMVHRVIIPIRLPVFHAMYPVVSCYCISVATLPRKNEKTVGLGAYLCAVVSDNSTASAEGRRQEERAFRRAARVRGIKTAQDPRPAYSGAVAAARVREASDVYGGLLLESAGESKAMGHWSQKRVGGGVRRVIYQMNRAGRLAYLVVRHGA